MEGIDRFDKKLSWWLFNIKYMIDMYSVTCNTNTICSSLYTTCICMYTCIHVVIIWTRSLWRMSTRKEAELVISSMNQMELVPDKPLLVRFADRFGGYNEPLHMMRFNYHSTSQKKIKEERKLKEIKSQILSAEAVLVGQVVIADIQSSLTLNNPTMSMSLPASPATPMFSEANSFYSPGWGKCFLLSSFDFN